MKLFVFVVCITGALAGGGHRHGGGGVVATPLIIAQPYIAAQPYIPAPRYVRAAPRFVAPAPLHSYGPQRTIIHQQHVVQPVRRTVIQPVERTIIQPVEKTIIQPVEKTFVQRYVEPVERTMPMPLYEKEVVEEKVFRDLVSKTMTEGPDDVHRVKRTVNKHYPMLHETLTKHYTIQDEEENNIIHHFYDEQDNYLGMRKGRKFSGGTQHVEHPEERFEMSEKFAPEHVEVEHVIHEEAPMARSYTTRAAPATATMAMGDMDYMESLPENVMRSASSSMGSSGMVMRSVSSSMGSMAGTSGRSYHY